jgi:alkaline phosphatase D
MRRAIFYISLILFIGLINEVLAQGQNPPEHEQYKKQNRDRIAQIYDGKTEDAIRYFQDYLSKYPSDQEAMFGLVVAYASQSNVKEAMQYAEKVLELGFPVERFLAGPRVFLQPLLDDRGFRKLIEGRYQRLLHGPMLGAVTDTQARFWIRTFEESEFRVEVYVDGDQWNKLRFTGNTTEANDYTAVVIAEGLSPNTKYQYKVFVDGSLFFTGGSFKTSAAKGQSVQIALGFGGGAGYTPWKERMWDTISVHKLDAFLQLGDNVYIDHPTRPPVQEYCYYRRQSRPEYRRFVSKTPIYAIWDDHDFTINDGEGGPEIEAPAWKRPVWNIFKNQWNNPYYGGGEDHPGCWFDFTMGDVDFFMLDCRYYRENPQEVEEPSMLGAYQMEWLKEKLKASKGTFKVIASSVPWAIGTKPGSDDTWDGFAKEREAIFSFIEENKIEGVLLISADRHRSDAWKIERPNGYTLYDLMSSRLTNIHVHKIMPASLFGYNKTCSFGKLEFDTTAEDPKVVYSIFSIDNELIHRMTLYRSQFEFDQETQKEVH